MREISPRRKSLHWPLPLWYWPLASRLLPKNKVIRVAENKQWDHGELGCPELTWDGCPCSLALISQVPPTHLLTFLSQAGTLSRHRSNVLQRCMTATASLRESLTLRSTIHLMIFRKEKVQTSFYLSFLLLFNSWAGAVCTANNTSCGGSIPCIGEMRACF